MKRLIKPLIISFIIILVVIIVALVLSVVLGVSPFGGKHAEIVSLVHLDYSIENGEVTITGCPKIRGKFVIPSNIKGYPVTAIDKVTSSHYDADITSIQIPDSVARISNDALYQYFAVENIIVDENNNNYSSVDGVLFNKNKTELIRYPENNKRIDYKVPDSVTTIGAAAFDSCIHLVKIEIPDSVTNIGKDAFNWCVALKRIELPSSVSNMEFMMFYGCKDLTDIIISNDNKNYAYVDGVLFNNDKTELIMYPQGLKAESYAVPNGVVSIYNYAFANCNNLKSITIPEGVTGIDHMAFYYCEKLTDIIIPYSVTYIGKDVFKGCTNVTLHVKAGSYSEQYAKDNGIKFVVSN